MVLNNNTERGFSLIELLVAISILATISIIVLANHTRFNGSVLLSSLAYDIALSVREAQVFGVSVRQYDASFQLGYGVLFEGAASYSLFADTNSNKVYDNEDVVIRAYGLQRGFRIQQFCGINTLGTPQCSNDSLNPITHLAIVFLRPEPDAFMSSNILAEEYSRGTITIVSPGGDTRTVEVASTGQISVQNP